MGRDVKFALGQWDGLCSATWKVWPGSDGSVYIADRNIGGKSKVSLHPRDPTRPGQEWRIAFNTPEIAQLARPDESQPDRVIDAWDSEMNRLPAAPLREAFGVVLGRPSLGYYEMPDDSTQLAKVRGYRTKGVDWSAPMPSVDQLWQFTVLIGDPNVRTTAPGTRAHGAVEVGMFVLPSSEQVWVMRRLIPFTEKMKADVAEKMRSVVNAGDRSWSGVRRAHLMGREPSGFRWIFDLAVTRGDIPEALLNF